MLNLKEIRKELHKIPELGFEEYKTQKYILSNLENFKDDIKIITWDFTGIIVEYRTNNLPFTLYRADMDGLAIDEKTDVDFPSSHEGRMHACGHDIHMTVLIGLIEKVVTEKPDKNVLFLFQPAEEGRGGGKRILDAKLFENYNIKETYALHVTGDYPVGTIATKPGIIFGIPLEFKIEFFGKSAHAALPQKGNDALLAGIHFYQAMKSLISTRFKPTDTVIFHVGRMVGGQVENAVPDHCLMLGTIRILSKENRDKIQQLTIETAETAAKLMQVETKINFPGTYDPVINNHELYNKIKERMPKKYNFAESETKMVGEDFGFFTSKYKGLLFWLGAGEGQDLHSPYFLPDPDCIEVGINTMYSLL